MRKIVVFSNLLALSAVLGMQDNFVEGNAKQSGNLVAIENLSPSDSCKTWTPREWITKIIGIRRNKEVFNAPQNSDGQTILMCATKYSDCKIMQQVLNAKDTQGNMLADINALDKHGNTALSIAVVQENLEKIGLLLKNGADVKLAKKTISKKMKKKLKNFLKQLDEEFYALNCNQLNSEGRTQLMIECVNASLTKNIEKVKRWLDQPGIDVNLQSDERCKRGELEPVGYTALMWAVRVNCKEVVELLLSHPNVKDKIDVNIRDAKGNTALMLAASLSYTNMEDNEGIVELLLSHPNVKDKIDVNIHDTEGNTALMRAVISDNREIAELLLSHPNVKDKIDVNIQNNGGATALCYAVTCGEKRIVDLLLKHPNIDVNIKSNSGETSLMTGTIFGRQETVKPLLNHKDIDVNIQNEKGITALMYATADYDKDMDKLRQSRSYVKDKVEMSLGKQEIVKLLLNHEDIDVNIRDEEGKTALIWAVDQNQKEIVELLLNHPNVREKIDVNLECDWEDKPVLTSGMSKMPDKMLETFAPREMLSSLRHVVRDTALSLAAARGHEEVVKLLLDRPEIDINACFPDSALANAARGGHRGIVKLLLDHPKIDVTFAKALEVNAINNGRTDIAELLRNHPKIKNGTCLSFNVFSLACISDEKVIKYFLDEGINVNEKDFFGYTMLMYAAEAGNARVVRLLLDQPNIDINIQNDDGETALDCAERAGRRGVRRLMLSKTGQNQQPDPFIEKIKRSPADEIRKQFLNAVSQGNIDQMDSLLYEKLIDVNSVLNESGNTALIIASENGNLDAVRMLLSYEADLSLKDRSGSNALIRAARKGYFDVVEELLFRKANINSVGQHGRTALMEAAENDQVRVVKLLIKKGAKPSVKDNSGKTALDLVNAKIEEFSESLNAEYKDIKNLLESRNKPSDLANKPSVSESSSNGWEVTTSNNYEKQLKEWEKNSPNIYQKIQYLSEMIKSDPFRGPGRPEYLPGRDSYSRRITDGDRLEYEIDGDKVILKSCKGHYDD